MPWNADVVSYLDSGTYYLTPEQQDAVALLINVKIVSYANPVSQNFKWSPPRSVYGYATGVQDRCVVFEEVVNYDYQRIYYDTQEFRSLNRNLCRYQRATEQNFIRLYNSLLVTKLPFDPIQVVRLEDTTRRQLDSIRFRTLNRSQFNIEVRWFTLTPEEVCDPNVVGLPPLPSPRTTPSGPQPGSSSPAEEPVFNSGQPVGPLTPAPPNAFPGDFGDRNEVFQSNLRLSAQVSQVVNGATCGIDISYVYSQVIPRPAGFVSVNLSDWSLTRQNTLGSSCGQWFGNIAFNYLGQRVSRLDGPIGWAASAGVMISVVPTSDPVE